MFSYFLGREQRDNSQGSHLVLSVATKFECFSFNNGGKKGNNLHLFKLERAGRKDDRAFASDTFLLPKESFV